MKVTQASTYRTLQTNLSRNTEKLQDLYYQGSTGLKLNKASDDPSAIQPVLSARNQITLSERFVSTLGESSDKMASTDTSLATMENIFQRASEISINAVNSSLNNQDLEGLADEVAELKERMLDIANAQIDGKFIFAGYSISEEPFTENPKYDPALYDEADTSTWPVTYNGDSNRTTLEIGEGEYLEVALTGNELFSGIENSEWQAGNTGLTGGTMKSTGSLDPASSGDITITANEIKTTITEAERTSYTGDNYASHLADLLENTDTDLKTTINPATTDLGDLSQLSNYDATDTYKLTITSEGASVNIGPITGSATAGIPLADMATALGNATGTTVIDSNSGILKNGVQYDISTGSLVFTGTEDGADLELTETASSTPIIGTAGSVSYGTVDISTNSTQAVTIDGDTSALAGAGLTEGTLIGSTTTDIFGVLTRLEESLNAANLDDPDGVGGGVQDAIDKLDLAADQNRRKRSQLGVKAARVDDEMSLQEETLIDIRTTLSRYEDADITETYNNIIQQESAYQAALTVTGRVSQISILDYL